MNFRGRFEYLEAAREHWPELLGSLHSQALARFVEFREAYRGEVPLTYSALGGSIESEPKASEVCGALKSWADEYGISDAWLLDAAVQTLAVWASGGTEMRWHYLAPEVPAPFQPAFGTAWVPPLTQWRDFKASTDKSYREQLQAYRQGVLRWWAAEAKGMPDQAIWTVLFQRGKSPGEIRLWEQRKGHRIEEATIQMGVRRFAASIGLTLRAPRHGPK